MASPLTESANSVRDLESEVQFYVRKMTASVKAVTSLCPLDTPEKVDQLTSVWDGFYEVISFTTLDSELESAILQHPDIIKLLPEMRRILGEAEGALETTWADRVAAAKDSEEAWKIFTTTPLHQFYTHLLKTEWAAVLTVLDRAPESVAILGSGAMPETAVYIKEWAKKNNQRVKIYSLELLPSRLEKSINVINALCGSEDCTFETADIRSAPKDLSAYDVVYFNAAVGATMLEKENMLLDIVGRMKSGTIVLARSTHSLKTMAYPPVQLQTQRILKKLRPVLTCHLSGDPGRSANASLIVSRVV